MISFRTASGRRINLERPRGEDIEIVDIARGLSNCCRFAGQLPRFYSVAQHSVMVSMLCPRSLRLAALLHDGSEAYMGDLSRNLKHHDLLKGYRALEAVLQTVIWRRFGCRGLSEADHARIKQADDLAAIVEHLVLREHKRHVTLVYIRRLLNERFVRTSLEALRPLVPLLPEVVTEWSPDQAERKFLVAFEAYRNIA